MTRFGLQPLGEIRESILHEIQEALEKNYPVDIFLMPPMEVAAEDFDSERRKHNAPLLLRRLLATVPAAAEKFLAITNYDLFIPMLSFVYGQAQLNGRAALISVARLSQQFYGLPENEPLLHQRACKEAVHETGHLHALVHCRSELCSMSLSTNVRQLDLKTDELCASCRALIWESKK